jgi:hypothetical protein
MDQRDDRQNHRGNYHPTDRESEDVPVTADSCHDGIALAASPNDGELGDRHHKNDYKDNIVELTDNGASDLGEQTACARFVRDPVHLAYFSDACDHSRTRDDGEESNGCTQNSEALSNQFRANQQNADEH